MNVDHEIAVSIDKKHDLAKRIADLADLEGIAPRHVATFPAFLNRLDVGLGDLTPSVMSLADKLFRQAIDMTLAKAADYNSRIAPQAPKCIACGGTGKNSKGGLCICAKGKV